ncbi:HNH endonuclease [Devosia sp.]|uniref:HNH endonuclease n=1 Tax=Devosia sp. TaxID=1871048 RepID=UPI0027357EA3|nr:HNH endonuclease [Devosia sp.]MDP2779763.1 HNH endonuclease [Devosia sp.]
MSRKPRPGISKKDRFEVFKRDKFTCQYCGRSAPEVVLQVDHITPVSKQGEDDVLNLITCCKDCNAGKSDRELTDDTAIRKRKAQLDELQERREQIEMMVEWQRGLIGLGDQQLESAADLWNSLTPGYYLNDYGRQELKKIIGRFGFQAILEAMRTSAQQYLKRDEEGNITHESVDKANDFVGRIAAARQRAIEKPWMQELYYIRGIMRNHFLFFSPYSQHLAMCRLEEAYEAGITTETLKRVAMQARNWSGWQDEMDFIMAKQKG